MMHFRDGKRNERGSVTVEASISMVVFMFFIISLLQFINVSRAQMLIQVALNKSAQEIAQYMYLYKVVGLYDADVSIQNSATTATNTINTVASDADSTFAAFETISADIFAGGTGADPDGTSFDAQIQRLQNIANTAQGDAQVLEQTLKASASDMKQIFQQVRQNPIAFLKSLGALAASGGMSIGKSYIIGELLAGALMEKYLETPYADADTRLRVMNVIDGLDGLSFSQSKIFMTNAKSAGGAKDINLIVTYQVRLFPLFSRDLKATFAQSASVQAWLGGDTDFSVFTSDKTGSGDSDADSGEENDSGDNSESGDGDSSSEQPAEENSETESETEPENEETPAEETEKKPSAWDTMEGRMGLQNAYLLKETTLNTDVYYIELNGYQFLYDASSGKVTGVIVNSITDYEDDSKKKDVLLAAAYNGVTTTDQLFENALMNGGTLTATKNGKSITIDRESVKEYSVTIIVPKDSDPGTDVEQVALETLGESGDKKYSFDVEEMEER